MQFVRFALFAAAFLLPTPVFAEWGITDPLESEDFSEEADIITSGSCNLSTEEVYVKLQRKTGEGPNDYTTIDQSDNLNCTNGTWGPHNFGPQSEGAYRIQLFEFGEAGVKSDVRFTVSGDPE